MLNIRRKKMFVPISVTIVLLLFNNGGNVENYRTVDVEDGSNMLKVKSNYSAAEVENDEKQLPSVAVVGVKKCGTGALIEVLRMHPSIVAPPYDETEVAFWGDEELMRNGLEFYKNLMPKAKPNQTVVVKIPGLTRRKNSSTITQLYEALPGLKLLLIVRNPVTRIVSHIVHEFYNPGGIFFGHELLDIDDIIMGRVPDIDAPKPFEGSFLDHLLYMSNYKRIYDRYSSVYPKGSIYIVNGDELITHPAIEIKKLEKFLGLRDFYRKEHFFFHADNGGQFPCFTVPEMRCMGSDKGLSHPSLRKETVQYLMEILQPMMDEFRQETGVDIIL